MTTLPLALAFARRRMLFCAIVAVLAAAFCDPLLEFASNAGAFGACDCTDHSNLDIVPAFCVGLTLAIVLLSLRVRKAIAVGFGAAASAARESLRPDVLVRLVPLIFTLQLAVLFVMETAEQVIVSGHPLGGAIWLGAPVPIGLTVHAAIGLGATLALGRVLSACTLQAVRVVAYVRQLIATSPIVSAVTLRSGFDHRPRCSTRPPLVCRIGKRAPPLAIA